eukprot:7389381-Prymnesium_polylepis.1
MDEYGDEQYIEASENVVPRTWVIDAIEKRAGVILLEEDKAYAERKPQEGERGQPGVRMTVVGRLLVLTPPAAVALVASILSPAGGVVLGWVCGLGRQLGLAAS